MCRGASAIDLIPEMPADDRVRVHALLAQRAARRLVQIDGAPVRVDHLDGIGDAVEHVRDCRPRARQVRRSRRPAGRVLCVGGVGSEAAMEVPRVPSLARDDGACVSARKYAGSEPRRPSLKVRTDANLPRIRVPVTPRTQRNRAALTTIAAWQWHISISLRTSRPRVPGSAGRTSCCTSLWGMFWLLMLAVAVQDYIRNGGKQLVAADPLGRHVARWWRRSGSCCSVASTGAMPSISIGRWRWFGHHVKWLPLIVLTFVAVGLRDPPWRLRAGRRRPTSTSPGRTCCSTSRSSWSCSPGCGWA